MKTIDVGLLLLDLAIIIAVARLFGAAAQRVGQPRVVGEIVAGILLGPTAFGPVLGDTLFPATLRPALGALANIGLVLFMFIVGYELDKSLLKGRKRVAVTVSIGSILLPMALGALLGIWLAQRHGVVRTVPFVLFLAAAMSVTAFPVLARILTDKHLNRTRIGGVALASAAVDDVVAWSLLAVVVAIAGPMTDDYWRTLLVFGYLAIMLLVVRPLLGRLVAMHRRQGQLRPGLLAAILVGLLLSCAATEWLGIHFIFGAFLFGMVMPRLHADELRHQVRERLEQVSVLLLLPVFFVLAGLNVDLSGVDPAQLLELALILAVAISGKFVGAYAGARAVGIAGREACLLATLMNTRGLTEIVILTVGLQMGLLDRSLFSLMVVMALVTTAMAGPLMHLIYPRNLMERDIAEAAGSRLGNMRVGAAVRSTLPLEPAPGRENGGTDTAVQHPSVTRATRRGSRANDSA